MWNMKYFWAGSGHAVFLGGGLWKQAGSTQRKKELRWELDCNAESNVDMGGLTKFRKGAWKSLKDSAGDVPVMDFN